MGMIVAVPENLGEEAEDKSDPITIEIKKEERKVIITKVEGPKNITTSSQEQYTVTVTNLGSEDEEKVSVIAYNSRLNFKPVFG